MAITDEMLDEIIGSAKTQDDVFGRDGLINTLSKRLLERMFDSEMTHHLGYEKHDLATIKWTHRIRIYGLDPT